METGQNGTCVLNAMQKPVASHVNFKKKIKNLGIMKNNYLRKSTEAQSLHSVGVSCIT